MTRSRKEELTLGKVGEGSLVNMINIYCIKFSKINKLITAF